LFFPAHGPPADQEDTQPGGRKEAVPAKRKAGQLNLLEIIVNMAVRKKQDHAEGGDQRSFLPGVHQQPGQ
jgi:hypothetical protein